MNTEACDVYVSQLRHLNSGAPLYDPQPHWYDEVRPGDVGYIENGGFHRLFNITLPHDHPSHRFYGVPEGFIPIESPPHATYMNDPKYDPGPLHSASVSYVEFGASVVGSAVPGSAGIEFTCATGTGAVLFLRRRAIGEYTYLMARYKRHMIENYKSWYQFANNHHGRGLRSGQLLLVTSCDKTAEWASAVFSRRRGSASIKLFGGVPGVVRGAATIAGIWERSASVIHKTAPSPSPPVRNDQTIFLRALKVFERPFMAPKVMKAAAEPQPADERNWETDSPGEVLSCSPEYHPADALAEYIFQHSDDQMAIIHDDDWCNSTWQPFPGTPPLDVEPILKDHEERFFHHVHGSSISENNAPPEASERNAFGEVAMSSPVSPQDLCNVAAGRSFSFGDGVDVDLSWRWCG